MERADALSADGGLGQSAIEKAAKLLVVLRCVYPFTSSQTLLVVGFQPLVHVLWVATKTKGKQTCRARAWRSWATGP